MDLKINRKGQIVGQACSHCARPSEVCVGRCLACGGAAEWDEREGGYICPCGEAALYARRLIGPRSGED